MPYDANVGTMLRLSLTPAVHRPGSAEASELTKAVRSATDTQLADLVRATNFHGVAGYVHNALSPVADLPESTRDALRELRDRTALFHLRTVADVAYLHTHLSEADLPWLAFKGPTLAEPVHGSAQLRSYSDLDLLVPARRLEEVMGALQTAGSTLLDRNWTLIHREMKAEVHLQLPSGTSLDLHWHLFNDPERRQRFPVSIDEIFSRARTVTLNRRQVPTLSLADTLVYVAMHTMHSGADRLIWLKDLERLLALTDLDPEAVAERARAWRAELVLTSAIRRVELALGTPERAAEIRALCKPYRVWGTLTSQAWRRSPAEREDGNGSLGRIVSRSTRTAQGDSFRELLRRGLDFRRAHAEDPDQGPRHFSADDPRSGQFPSGGPATRDAYLREVAEQAS